MLLDRIFRNCCIEKKLTYGKQLIQRQLSVGKYLIDSYGQKWLEVKFQMVSQAANQTVMADGVSVEAAREVWGRGRVGTRFVENECFRF